MAFKPSLIMSRNDVTVDHKQVICPNTTWIGYSSNKLRPGMFFSYKQGASVKLGRMHHRIASGEHEGYIVAQVAIDSFMANHCERWVNPNDVTETRPMDKVDAEIVDLFNRRVSMWE